MSASRAAITLKQYDFVGCGDVDVLKGGSDSRLWLPFWSLSEWPSTRGSDSTFGHVVAARPASCDKQPSTSLQTHVVGAPVLTGMLPAMQFVEMKSWE